MELPQWVEGTGAVRLVVLPDETSAQAQVRDGKLAAAIVVPSGFSQRIWQGENDPLILVGDPAGQNGQAALSTIQSAAKRMLGAVEAARLATGSISGRQPFANLKEEQTFRWERFQTAKADWQNTPLSITLQAASGSAPAIPSGFAQSSPGILVQFAIFGLITSAMLLVVERKTRTLQRLLTTSITRWQVIAGHTLAMFVVVFLQELILILLGQFAFGVNYPGGSRRHAADDGFPCVLVGQPGSADRRDVAGGGASDPLVSAGDVPVLRSWRGLVPIGKWPDQPSPRSAI